LGIFIYQRNEDLRNTVPACIATIVKQLDNLNLRELGAVIVVRNAPGPSRGGRYVQRNGDVYKRVGGD